MKSPLRAMVISSSIDVLQHIQNAFHTTPDVELSLHTNPTLTAQGAATPNVLIVHGEEPTDWLRSLRRNGYRQPALVLTADTDHPNMTPLEDDLRPLENVSWAVMRAGGLPHLVDTLIAAQ